MKGEKEEEEGSEDEEEGRGGEMMGRGSRRKKRRKRRITTTLLSQVTHSHLWLNQIKMYAQNIHLSETMFYNSEKRTEQLNQICSYRERLIPF